MTNSKKWLYAAVLILLLGISIRSYYRLTDDFRLSNIKYNLPFEAPWQNAELTAEKKQHLTHIFDQKFYYIGKGAQCYAFASEDEQYILKFFKFKHLKPSGWINLLPPIPPFKDFKQQCAERKKRKLIGVFNGYDLAYREHCQEAKLIYLHLIPIQSLNLQATIVDKIGLTRQIDLDEVIFLIQRKGETLRCRLTHLLNQGKLAEAEHALSQILNMYVKEYQKGLFDHDHGVMQNTGFVGEQPFHLDVGKLNKDDRVKELAYYKKDLSYVIWKMDFWIKNAYPAYYPHFANFLANEYQSLTGETLDLKSIDPKQFKKNR